MHIILTHEQADFDALASLLGASLLHDTALPVLPRRMNRNVRAFLTLYGTELPFIDPRDLPSNPIDMVTLVDTQSSVSVKGMGPSTEVHVIDHHPRRDDLPDGWTVLTQEIGATATLLVESLREQDLVLTTVQSTLLLLGVYEDTGSLTYTRTTPRDLRAAAFLIEQGANLGIASDFLNHPLSHDQQIIYDRLRDSAQHFSINGHAIIVACGDARETDEELSTIAHKMRDLLDPDALFLLLTTRGGVQLIARSTTDNIDVAEVAARFGGGGHDRAAASLIRDRDLQSVCDELGHILSDYVRPAITVAEIMSSEPQLLTPDISADEAAQRMQRYGYEGFPVVQDGKVVGLLTRRAVDRALSHKLDLTAASLMDAGDFSVNPDDSIERLQNLVTESGWGQIPVVEPESGEIVGIVTRTDLLKTLTPKPIVPGRFNLADKLESILPEDRLLLLKTIAKAAYQQHAALYIVGGFVRDLLLEIPSLDFDLVVEGDAIKLAHYLAKKHGGRVTSHSRFGTAKWHLDDHGLDGRPCEYSIVGLESVDLVSARTEFYTHPTALPTVERGSIKLDLHRRDFTINTLALRLDGRHYGDLHDYWGGYEDLKSGVVRVLHSLSFVDDPTRILRAVRFEQRFKFRIAERTMQLLLEARPLIERLSGDRIRHELDYIMSMKINLRILSRLHQLDLLKMIHRYLKWDEWLRTKFGDLSQIQPEVDWGFDQNQDKRELRKRLAYVLWMIRLLPQEANAVINRLRLPVNLKREILSACEIWRDQDSLAVEPPSAVVSWQEDVPLLARYAIFKATSNAQIKEVLWRYASQWQAIEPGLDGNDLKSRGIPPGPVYRKILDSLRDAWLDGKVTNSSEESAHLEKILQELEE